jgi:hypothetical protein
MFPASACHSALLACRAPLAASPSNSAGAVSTCRTQNIPELRLDYAVLRQKFIKIAVKKRYLKMISNVK